MRSFAAIVFSFLVLTTFESSSRASTIRLLSFGERVAEAGLIVRGRVVGLEPVRRGTAVTRDATEKESVFPRSESDAEPETVAAFEAPIGLGIEGGQMLFTRVTFEVEEEIFGVGGRELVFEMAGGVDGDRAVIVHGMPEFQMGLRYLLFLRPEYESVGDPVVGVYQGFFQVVNDPVGNEILLDSNGDFVTGIEADELVLRHNAAEARRPAPTFIAGPTPDGAGAGAAAAETSAEALHYWYSTEAPMTVTAFADAVRQAKGGVR